MFRKLKYILIYSSFMLDSPARRAGQLLVKNKDTLKNDTLLKKVK